MKKHSDILGKIAYACGDIYGGGSFLIVGLLLLVFLTKVERLPGAWAGAIIFVGKAWDAVTDPLMGMLSDRTRSKFGRRRFYFLIGAIPVFVSWVMLWYSFGITGETAKIIYYMIAFMFFSTAFTIVMVPYNAILADMTDDYNKRSAFTGVRLSFSAGAAILCGTVPGMIMGMPVLIRCQAVNGQMKMVPALCILRQGEAEPRFLNELRLRTGMLFFTIP
jgi:oligogalacturonide transporter